MNKQEGINVLSLFDGMSCGQIALQRLGIKVNQYFASEIDKHAIKVTQHNFPETIQLGDVTKIVSEGLPKIDLLMGGSPCQGFSFAGKQLNFDDPRSKLFFEYVRLLREVNPRYFLLENVVMKKEYQEVISKELGVEPVLINSSLVSAQNRRRLYWSNLGNITQPEDLGITWLDVKENSDSEVINMTPSRIKMIANSECLDTRLKSYTLTTKRDRSAKSGASFNYTTTNQGQYRYPTFHELEALQTIPKGYTDVCTKKLAREKMIGNGWTVDVICHILKNMEL